MVTNEDLVEEGNILLDQNVRFSTKRNRDKYPPEIRRIVAYIPDKKSTFTFYTNNFYLSAETIVLLYKNRWQVELLFKWIKQHLKVKSFWGTSENAVRIQIYTPITTYCLMAIIEHDMKLNRNIFEVMRIISSALLSKESLVDLLVPAQKQPEGENPQLEFDFGWC